MRFLSILPAILVAVSALAFGPLENPTPVAKRDSWGGAVSLGPSKSTITKAVTTITPGNAPPVQNGVLFLWPGMSNGTGDLVQTTLESWQDNSWCGAMSGQWCIRCSLFGSFGQLDGPAGVVSGDQKVEIKYELATDGQTWVQTATDVTSGTQLSTFSYKSGPYMLYENTVITLASADSTFGNTISTSQGATYSGLTNTGGGKVWTIAKIDVPKMV
ncbi:uncharacterized protein N0V89_008320 [Didymosphaeria variabile]|uniref:Concanavalin A-like lectin/glucanase n=1 Tax=Didymosphaeria variabile TaxID=1932322 RepID=A0A9W9C8Q4_9PLEO|nr:uncharacterized protein N0V89_008320 [Didymosphaeria variabile]KAJ4349703.1 hypothetical protein N0V89_008320 [Didymosphaeria variabile]